MQTFNTVFNNENFKIEEKKILAKTCEEGTVKRA